MGSCAEQQALAAPGRGGKKSLERSAKEIFGKEKDACCPEGEVVVECLLLKLFNSKSLCWVFYPCSLPHLSATQASPESTKPSLSPSTGLCLALGSPCLIFESLTSWTSAANVCGK